MIRLLPRFAFRRRKNYEHDDAFEYVRPRLVDLIKHRKQRLGSAMEAVKAVARDLGEHEGWVRRIVGRYGEVKIQLHQGLNIMSAHIAMKRQQRIERKAARRATSTSATLHA